MPSKTVWVLLLAMIATGCQEIDSNPDANNWSNPQELVASPRNLFVGAAAFRDAGNASCTVCPGSATMSVPSGIFWALTGTRSVVADLQLPAGTVVHNLVARVLQGASNTTTPVLFEGSWTLNNVAVGHPIIGGNTTVTGGWTLTPSIPDPAFVIKDNSIYFLALSSHDASNSFGGMMLSISDP